MGTSWMCESFFDDIRTHSLADRSWNSLLMCFAIVARDDLSLVPLVKVIEEKIVRRRTPICALPL